MEIQNYVLHLQALMALHERHQTITDLHNTI